MQANLTPESVEAMKVNELKDALGSLGLSIKGLKAELKAELKSEIIKELKQAMEDDKQEDSS